MGKLVNFISHVYTAIRYGDWDCGFELWKGKPTLDVALMPYDGWNFCLHIHSFYLCVNYPWCGDCK